jgi:hypothetical protein
LIDKPASLAALAASALRLCAARFPIFAASALVGLAVEAAIYFLLHPKTGVNVGDLIVGPMVATVVYVFAAADLPGDESRRITRPWERILERVWAVVVIEFIQALIFSAGLGAMLVGNAFSAFVGATVIFMFATLVFSDVFAAVEPNLSPVTMLFLGFVRSVQLTWRGNIARVLFILALTLILNAMQTGLITLLTNWHIRDAAFWGDAPFALFATIPLAAFTALVYFDCVARERLSSDKRD